MNWIFKYLTSSIGKKHLMAVTGLLLIGFLVGHVAGNLLLVLGEQTFNTYSHALISNPLIIPIELGLLSIFLLHIGLAIWTNIENKNARPNDYAMPVCEQKQKLSSSFMIFTGIIVAVFVVYHIIGIKFGPSGPGYIVTHNGVEMRDLYKLVLEYFQSPIAVLLYTFSMVVLGVHLTHGFWSLFQSLGISHKKYTPILKVLSVATSVAISGGFIFCVVWACLKGA